MNRKPAVLSAVLVAGVIAVGAFAQTPPAPTLTPTPTSTPSPTPTPTPAPPSASIPEGTQLPSEVALGASVSVPVRNVTAADRFAVVLNDAKRDYAASTKLEGSSVNFTLPTDALPGRYTVRIVINEKTVLPVPGELRVAGSPQATPVITGISTPVYPPEEGGSLYSFSILGDHFGNERDTSVEIAQRTIKAEATDCSGSAQKPCIKVSPRMIDVYGFTPRRFEGPVKVSVLVGNLRSEAKEITFSHYSVRSVRFLAFLGTALIGLLVYFLVRRGVGRYQIGHQHYNVFSIFIIDKDTHSYSLSKLQLLLWTFTSVFTYIYFYLSRVLIQWSGEFPDVPPGLPTLLGLSAGTTVVAAGLTAARGPKGAGPLSPTPADFISSGGVVVAERFQFFVWTIVGILSFIGLVLNSDPAHLSTLPTIPDNFLMLMGVSSAGYLAGKAVRRPGPVISRANVSGTSQQLMLKVDGLNIEEKATIRIDKKEYHPTPDQNNRKAQEGDGKFYTHLEWTIPWESGFDAPTHQLEIVNDDGQVATKDFTLKAFQIGTVSEAQATKNEAVLIAAVSDCNGTFEGEWSPPGAAMATPIPPGKIEAAGSSVRIKLTPGETAGLGRLALVDSAGQRALASVKVIAVTMTPTSVPANAAAQVTVSGTDLPALTKAKWTPAKGGAKDAPIAKFGNAYQVTFDAGGEKGEGTLEVSADNGFTAQAKITVT
jgi:hypothetical protein